MKKNLFFINAMLFLFSTPVFSQSVAVNTDGSAANASAILDIKSTTKGLLAPRMTTVQRNAVTTPATGLMVFDTDTQSFWYMGTAAWVEISNSATELWKTTSSGTPHSYNSNQLPVLVSNSNTGVYNSILNVHKTSATTTGLLDVLSVQRSTNSVSPAANGIGGSIVFNNESSTGPFLTTARISGVQEDVGFFTYKSALRFDVYGSNGLSAVNNQMFLNSKGLRIGSTVPANNMLDVTGDINTTGKVMRPQTGAANLVPICIGNVNEDGSINANSSTNNFTVHRPGPGEFEITISGQFYSPDNFVTMVTIGQCCSVKLLSPRVAFTNTGILRIEIFDGFASKEGERFQFVVYKLY